MHRCRRCRAARRKTVQIFDSCIESSNHRYAQHVSHIGEFAAHRNISEDNWNKESEAMLLSARSDFPQSTGTARLKNAAPRLSSSGDVSVTAIVAATAGKLQLSIIRASLVREATMLGRS
jgi:hypothetical protein